jgi:hypothetical protein
MLTLGIPAPLVLQIHVVLSFIGIFSGFIVLYGLLTARPYPRWTALFLATTMLTSATGFPLPPFGFDPPRVLGVISLMLLALAMAGLYAFHLAGAWRWIYAASAVAALYLNVFVGIVQAFEKVALLQRLAPTQSEAPFVIAQLLVLGAFVLFGVLAAIRFRSQVPAAT